MTSSSSYIDRWVETKPPIDSGDLVTEQRPTTQATEDSARCEPEDALVVAIIVTYNSESYISSLLDSLPAAFGSQPRQTVVVDNGSSDRTLALLKSRGDCVVVPSTNTGYAAGLNRGMEAAREADYILVLNPDTILGQNCVPNMIQEMMRPQVGIVAPMVFESDWELSMSLRRKPTLLRVGGLSFTRLPVFSEIVRERNAYLYSHVVDWAMGAVLLVSKKCWDSVKGLDESFFLYSEETDFCLRASDEGWLTRYTPLAHAKHIGGGSGENSTTHTMKMVNRVRLFHRRHNEIETWAYFILVILIEIRRGIFGHKPSWTTVVALVRPSLRPIQLNCSDQLLPS